VQGAGFRVRPGAAETRATISGSTNPGFRERELFIDWSGSTDVVGGPASRHGSLNSLFQVAVYLPS